MTCVSLGQIIFDATGQVDISGVDAISEAMVDGLISLGEQQNVSQSSIRAFA